jgi:transposase
MSSDLHITVAVRAAIIIALADGITGEQVAERLGVSRNTVALWRDRYLAHGIAGLQDRPRSGQPKKVTPEVISVVDHLIRHRIPASAPSWSIKSLAETAQLTTWQVRQALAALGFNSLRINPSDLPIERDGLIERIVNIDAVIVSASTQALVLELTEPPISGQFVGEAPTVYVRTRLDRLYAAYDKAVAGKGTAITLPTCSAQSQLWIVGPGTVLPDRGHVVRTDTVATWLYVGEQILTDLQLAGIGQVPQIRRSIRATGTGAGWSWIRDTEPLLKD